MCEVYCVNCQHYEDWCYDQYPKYVCIRLLRTALRNPVTGELSLGYKQLLCSVVRDTADSGKEGKYFIRKVTLLEKIGIAVQNILTELAKVF